MLVSLFHRRLFLLNPRTGTHSIRKALCDSFSWCEIGDPDDGSAHHSTNVPQCFRDFETFAVVRNPLTRFVSWWAYALPFQPFAEHITRDFDRATMQPPQVEWIGNARVDHVLRFESLERDLRTHKLIGDDPLPVLNTSHIAASEERALAHFTEPWMLDRVRTWYMADFDRFGY